MIFKINLVDIASFTKLITKRVILFNISKLFDPLGWIFLIVITAKIFMQKFLFEKFGCNNPVPTPLMNGSDGIAVCKAFLH